MSYQLTCLRYLALTLTVAGCSGRLAELRSACLAGADRLATYSCAAAAEEEDNLALRKEYRLRAARLRINECVRKRDGCWRELQTLFNHSEDPREVALVVEVSQRQCLEGARSACDIARRAAWFGRGQPVDPGGSFVWDRRGRDPAVRYIWMPSAVELQPPDGWTPPSPAVRLQQIERLASDGEAELARLVLEDAKRRELVDVSDDLVERLDSAADDRLWQQQVEPARASRRFAAAVAAGQRLADAHRSEGLKRRLSGLRIEARMTHTEVARMARSRGLEFAAALHGALASRFGPGAAASGVDLQRASADVALRPHLRVRPSCEALRPFFEARFPAAQSDVELDAGFECTATERTWNTTERYTYTESEQRTVTRTIAGTTRQESYSCQKQTQSCTTIYGQYRCIPATTYATCTRSVAVPPRTVQEVVSTPKTREGTRQVVHREVHVTLSGRLKVPGSAPEPVQFARHLPDTARSLREVLSEAADHVLALVDRGLAARRQQAAAGWVSRAHAASDPLASEDALLRAHVLGTPARKLAQAYELTVADVDAALRGKPLSASALRLPPPPDAPAPVRYPRGSHDLVVNIEPIRVHGGRDLSEYPFYEVAPPGREVDER